MNIMETINRPEGRTLEFKSQVPDKLDTVLRTVIAFSNGSGGEIIIGIDDDRKIIGIDQDPFDLEERLASSIHDRIAAGLDIHQNTALKRLNRLMDADLVVKKGRGADVRYAVRV